ncbi:MAG: UDP-N-acetylglucosamine 2-epimerase (hydrolyzing) [Desulfobacterales bacterium]|nr:UDP-N-acetylglucosamine 2-epimerase (hydrolyzing) [Desulfobacterales bacterium]
MRSICFFTGTRAEYGLLKPLMIEIAKHPSNPRLQILVTGMHLSKEFGYTANQIESDGFTITEKVEMLLSTDTPTGICKSMGLGLMSYSDALERLKPDVLVILGDRFEAFTAAAAATVCRIPIAHIHGGESTFGLMDEAFRHAITKMSYLHFTSTNEYKRRVIQLGEHPSRVFSVGALGVENIRHIQFINRKELEHELGFHFGLFNVLVTFHPVTLEKQTASHQFQKILNALDTYRNHHIFFTKTNADTDGRVINTMIEQYVTAHPERSVVFTNLGQQRYFSLMKEMDAVLGNSSSGIIEAPSLGIPTVNIGDRQLGRITASSVIHCQPIQHDIVNALNTVLSSAFKERAKNVMNPYEKANTSKHITDILINAHLGPIQKPFYNFW